MSFVAVLCQSFVQGIEVNIMPGKRRRADAVRTKCVTGRRANGMGRCWVIVRRNFELAGFSKC